MKLQAKDVAQIRAEIAKRQAKSGLSYSAIAVAAKIHPSQVSRIFAGEFRTLNHGVVQVCNVLGITTPAAATKGARDPHEARIHQSAVALWDRTPEGADRIVRLLKQLNDLRRSLVAD